MIWIGLSTLGEALDKDQTAQIAREEVMKITRRLMSAGILSLGVLSAVGTGGLVPSAAKAVELPKTYDGQTIRVLIGTSPAWDPIRRISGRFTEATGVKVELTALSYTEAYQKLILDLTSGSASFDAFAFAYQWKHEMAPFMSDLANVEKEVSGAPAMSLDDYPGKILDVYGKVDGKLVGLPLLGDVTLFVWNKDAYTAAGLDPSEGPSTWAEVADRGKKLTSGRQYGFGLPAGKSPQTANIWTLVMHSLGGSYFDEDMKPTFNSKAGREAMHFIVENLQPIAPKGNLTWDFPEMLNSLMTGASSQSMMWPGGFGALLNPKQSQVATKVAWAPTPGVSLLGGWAFGVNDSSSNKEAAKLYAAWLTSPEVSLEYALAGGSPARASVLTHPKYKSIAPQADAVLAGLKGDVVQFPPVKESEQIVIMIYEEINAAAAGVKSPDQAVDDLQARVEAFMTKTATK